jgi:hypothetical protein
LACGVCVCAFGSCTLAATRGMAARRFGRPLSYRHETGAGAADTLAGHQPGRLPASFAGLFFPPDKLLTVPIEVVLQVRTSRSRAARPMRGEEASTGERAESGRRRGPRHQPRDTDPAIDSDDPQPAVAEARTPGPAAREISAVVRPSTRGCGGDLDLAFGGDGLAAPEWFWGANG